MQKHLTEKDIKEGKELMQILENLPEEGRKQVIIYASALVDSASEANKLGITNSYSTNALYITLVDKELGIEDVAQWKTWLKSNPIEVVYKVTTPTIKKLGKIEDFGELKTYYPITHITNNEDAEMVVEYVADTKNYVDNKVAANVANIISQYQTNISNLLSLMPIETQAAMIENDTNNILESEVTQ